jgi:hypothetical protein
MPQVKINASRLAHCETTATISDDKWASLKTLPNDLALACITELLEDGGDIDWGDIDLSSIEVVVIDHNGEVILPPDEYSPKTLDADDVVDLAEPRTTKEQIERIYQELNAIDNSAPSEEIAEPRITEAQLEGIYLELDAEDKNAPIETEGAPKAAGKLSEEFHPLSLSRRLRALQRIVQPTGARPGCRERSLAVTKLQEAVMWLEEEAKQHRPSELMGLDKTEPPTTLKEGL